MKATKGNKARYRLPKSLGKEENGSCPANAYFACVLFSDHLPSPEQKKGVASRGQVSLHMSHEEY